MCRCDAWILSKKSCSGGVNSEKKFIPKKKKEFIPLLQSGRD